MNTQSHMLMGAAPYGKLNPRYLWIHGPTDDGAALVPALRFRGPDEPGQKNGWVRMRDLF
jgi:hypothetical protein